MYTGAAFAAFVSEDPAKTPPPLILEEKFRAPNSARSVFEKLAESDSPSYKERFAFSPDRTYTRAEACAVAEAYCELFWILPRVRTNDKKAVTSRWTPLFATLCSLRAC
jgi:hypothetical protein